MSMKRPMVEMDVTLKVVKGTHLTPLAQTFIPWVSFLSVSMMKYHRVTEDVTTQPDKKG